MKWLAPALLMFLASAAFALYDPMTGPIGGNNGIYPGGPDDLPGITGAATGSGGAPPPPLCSNSLDFSDACNSQYVPLL